MVGTTAIDSDNTEYNALVAAATRIERILSYLRILFCAGIYARFLALDGLTENGELRPAVVIETPAIVIAVAFSIWAIRRGRISPLSFRALTASVVLDAAICFTCLLPNALYPWPDYQGILRSPDSTAILIITLAAGFRLSPRIAMTGGACNMVSLASLVWADHVHPTTTLYSKDITLAATMLLSAVALGVVVAWRARMFVIQLVREVQRVVRAERTVAVVLEDQHDLRSLLGSLVLNTDRLLRESQQGSDLAARVRKDLDGVQEFMAAAKARVLGHYVSLQLPAPVAIKPAIRASWAAIENRFPQVRLQVLVPEGLQAAVTGGHTSLHRTMINVLLNACEGNGSVGAQSIVVEAKQDASMVVLTVSDDGPGFPSHILTRPIVECLTGKPKGSGLGLFVVESLVTASGGHVERRNRQIGAEVILTLPEDKSG